MTTRETDEIETEQVVAEFSGYVIGMNIPPQGEATLRIGVPFENIDDALPLIRHVGGTMFTWTVVGTVEDPDDFAG